MYMYWLYILVVCTSYCTSCMFQLYLLIVCTSYVMVVLVISTSCMSLVIFTSCSN